MRATHFEVNCFSASVKNRLNLLEFVNHSQLVTTERYEGEAHYSKR